MTLDRQLLRSSFEQMVENAPDLTDRFYEVLFACYPQVRSMFGRNTRRAQADMLAGAITAVLDHLDDASWLTQTLGALGAKHLDYGVTEEMYDWVGDSLLITLAEVAGPTWSTALERAWSDAYEAIRSLMLAGAEAAAVEPERVAVMAR